MFKETRGLDYALTIIKALHDGQKRDSRTIVATMGDVGGVPTSKSYTQKILQRMVRANLLQSSETGYHLLKPYDQLTIADVLSICDMPTEPGLLCSMNTKLLALAATLRIAEFCDSPVACNTEPIQPPDDDHSPQMPD